MLAHPILWFGLIFGLSWLMSLLGTLLTQAIQRDDEYVAFPVEWVQVFITIKVYQSVVPDDQSLIPVIVVATGNSLGTFTGIKIRKWRERRKHGSNRG